MTTMIFPSLVVAFYLIGVDALNSTSFQAVTSSSSEKLCIVAEPMKVELNVRSIIQCGTICTANKFCETYGYKSDLKECHLYDSAASQNYSRVLGCSSYKLRGSRPMRDCRDIQRSGRNVSGVYRVAFSNGSVIQVYCDMQTSGGGWLVFQRRMDGSQNFSRPWNDYAKGFGSLMREFWLGNDNLNLLTSTKRYKLRIDMTEIGGSSRYAEYDNFFVNSSADNYRLVSIGTYNGTAGDSLVTHQLGNQFSTYDKNNSPGSRVPAPCTQFYKGAWWYGDASCCCFLSNLNGLYLGGPHSSFGDGIEWVTWTGYYNSLKTTEMKIRPI